MSTGDKRALITWRNHFHKNGSRQSIIRTTSDLLATQESRILYLLIIITKQHTDLAVRCTIASDETFLKISANDIAPDNFDFKSSKYFASSKTSMGFPSNQSHWPGQGPVVSKKHQNRPISWRIPSPRSKLSHFHAVFQQCCKIICWRPLLEVLRTLIWRIPDLSLYLSSRHFVLANIMITVVYLQGCQPYIWPIFLERNWGRHPRNQQRIDQVTLRNKLSSDILLWSTIYTINNTIYICTINYWVLKALNNKFKTLINLM